MNFSDFFYFTGFADCADCNHFTDFVKVRSSSFYESCQNGQLLHTVQYFRITASAYVARGIDNRV